MQINKKGKYERFVSPSFWFGTRNGSHAFANSLFDRDRQVGKYLCINLQKNMLFLIKSNSECFS